MPETNQHNSGTDAEAAHENQSVEHLLSRRNKFMDDLMYVFGTLAVLGGVVLSIIGVFAGFHDHRSLALWIGYATCVFVLTGVFCYFQKRIAEGGLPKDRPELSIDHTAISLAPNKMPRISLTFTNRGTATANDFKIKGAILGRTSTIQWPIKPDEGITHDAFPEITRGATVTDVIDFVPPLHPESFKAINEQRSTFFFYFEGTYTDKEGKQFPPLKRCYQFDPELRKLISAPREYWPTGSQDENKQKQNPN